MHKGFLHMNLRISSAACLAFIFLCAFLIMLRQFTSPDYFSCFGSDSYQYTSWAVQFMDALREGVLWPRWTPLNFWGYGSPTFVLYPPLAFYLVAAADIILHSPVLSMKLVKLISLAAGAGGVYLLVRELYAERVALFSAFFYLLFPPTVLGLYIGGGFTSTVSLMWFPFIFLFLCRYVKAGDYLQALYAGACYGGLILTHIINAYMLAYVVIAFLGYMAFTRRSPRYLAGVPLVMAAGFAISSAYFLPFLWEKRFIGYDALLSNFRYYDYFLIPNRTALLPRDFYWTVYYPQTAGYVLVFASITLLTLLQVRKKHNFNEERERKITLFFAGVSLTSMCFMFGFSGFIWELVPFFAYINIPARWLNITAFAVLILSACGFNLLTVLPLSPGRRLSLLVLTFSLCIAIDYQYIFVSKCRISEHELLPARDINWLPEHLPAGVNPEALHGAHSAEKVAVINGKGEVRVSRWNSAERDIEVRAYSPLTVRVRTFYFPGWEAWLDGEQSAIDKEKGSGAMLVSMPAGRHFLTLKFTDTPIRYYSRIVSALSCIALCLAASWKKFRTLGTERKGQGCNASYLQQ